MSKAITVRVDENLKKEVEEMLADIGLNMTTYINASFKALLREKQVPFRLTSKQKANEEYWAKIDQAWQNHEDGKSITFTPEEFDAFTKLTPEEAQDFVDQRMGGLA